MHHGAAWLGALGGFPRISLDAAAPLKESDTGERGQPVHQLVLESRVASLWCRRLPLLVVPVAAAHGGGRVVADGQPGLRAIPQLQVVGAPLPSLWRRLSALTQLRLRDLWAR
jgi:hypothetical protein